MTVPDGQPIRILHVFHSLNPGGAETLSMNIYRHIDRDRVQFDFAVHTHRRSHYDTEIEALGGRVFPLPNLSLSRSQIASGGGSHAADSRAWEPALLPKLDLLGLKPGLAGLRAYRQALLEILREHGPFAGVHSHVHYFSGLVLRVAEAAGVPARLAHSHTTCDGETSSWRRRLYSWTMRRLLLRHATHLLGCSRAACQGLFGRACWRDPRVRVLPNAIDLRPYADPGHDRCALRQKLGLPADGPLIGHVGRFTPVKNHHFLIDAFAALLQRAPAAHLVLVGDGPLRAEVEHRIRAHGLDRRVHLLGIRADVPAILGALDVFVFPSLYEGLGMALIEAQAAGVPCVVSSAVPRDADLKLGLVQFLDLGADRRAWVERILLAQEAQPPVWADRRRVLQASGYDVRVLARSMEQLYR